MATTHSFVLHGTQALPVRVECRISRGLPSILIVGLPARSVREAVVRIRAALLASSLPLPPQRIVINLAPADLPKDGTGLDLAIAASILLTAQPKAKLTRCLLLGELGLSGSINPVRGLIGSLLAAKEAGFTTCLIPASQFHQAALIPGLTLIPLQALEELQRYLTGNAVPSRQSPPATPLAQPTQHTFDLADIAGQEHAKRALEIAAAGGHNVLLTGPPGTGKSLLAKALASLLPPLTLEEMLEVTHIHSLTAPGYEKLISQRPVRAPHHSSSLPTMIGGGRQWRPGEISQAHRGVLLLDEFPEFKRQVLESLRQPLEDRTIHLYQGTLPLILPADFILVATANPCPCGRYGGARCRCSLATVRRYQQKLSGPLLDRIDLFVEVASVDPKQLSHIDAKPSRIIQKAVLNAWHKQRQRQSPLRLNATLTNQEVRKFGRITPEGQTLLEAASRQLGLSARGYMRSLKVARTIADLAGSEFVEAEHVGEALQYRKRENA